MPGNLPSLAALNKERDSKQKSKRRKKAKKYNQNQNNGLLTFERESPRNDGNQEFVQSYPPSNESRLVYQREHWMTVSNLEGQKPQKDGDSKLYSFWKCICCCFYTRVSMKKREKKDSYVSRESGSDIAQRQGYQVTHNLTLFISQMTEIAVLTMWKVTSQIKIWKTASKE